MLLLCRLHLLMLQHLLCLLSLLAPRLLLLVCLLLVQARLLPQLQVGQPHHQLVLQPVLQLVVPPQYWQHLLYPAHPLLLLPPSLPPPLLPSLPPMVVAAALGVLMPAAPALLLLVVACAHWQQQQQQPHKQLVMAWQHSRRLCRQIPASAAGDGVLGLPLFAALMAAAGLPARCRCMQLLLPRR